MGQTEAKAPKTQRMLRTFKNKKELIEVLQKERDFKVLMLARGKALELSTALRPLGSKQVALIVLDAR